MSGWDAWVGRTEVTQDHLSESTLDGLAATLDHVRPPWPEGEAPPLFHWLFFLPHAPQSEIDIDGHPRRGGFLPPIDLPRRMWAGSRVRFLAPAPRNAALSRLSTIVAVRQKEGASGRLVFVTVRHEVAAAGVPVVDEEQDIVYRGNARRPAIGGSVTTPCPSAPATDTSVVRSLTADPAMIFRFSALTFNAHRIHYDRDYARDIEGYPGLVVQGPLLATLLMDLALRHSSGRRPRSFAFVARQPLFDGVPFELCLREEGASTALWTRLPDGAPSMTATLDWA